MQPIRSTRRAALALWAVLALALALATTPAAGSPAATAAEAAAETAAQEPGWLQRLNELRASAGLHPLVHDPERSRKLQEAVDYLAEREMEVTHQLPPDASADAREAASRSNLSHDQPGTTPEQVVDRWMTDPGHLVNNLNPDVLRTGFAQATRPDGGIISGLWTIQDREGEGAPAPTYPYLFPGDGTTVTLPPFEGHGFPDHLDSCEGFGTTAGFPITAMLAGPFDEPRPEATASALVDAGTGAAVEHCLLVDPDPITEGSAFLVPRDPLAPGTYTATLAVDGADRSWTFSIGGVAEPPGEPPIDPPGPVDPVVEEHLADSPSALSAAVSAARFEDGRASHAVLASAERFPDALAGTALTHDGPMLLTPQAGLAPEVAAELQRVLAPGGTAYLLGGTAALGPQVEAAVGDLGYVPVRLEGPTRIDTAVAVAEAVVDLYGATEAVIARAGSAGPDETAAWADSVAVGAYAAATGTPVLLTDSAALSAPVADALARLGIGATTVVGGTAAVSDAVLAELPAPRRVADSSRTGTAVAIAAELVGATGAVLIDGFAVDGWAGGLAGAGLASDRGWAVLLADGGGLPAETEAALPGCASEVALVGRPAFAEALRPPLAAALDTSC